jgi:hypothetical protein
MAITVKLFGVITLKVAGLSPIKSIKPMALGLQQVAYSFIKTITTA